MADQGLRIGRAVPPHGLTRARSLRRPSRQVCVGRPCQHRRVWDTPRRRNTRGANMASRCWRPAAVIGTVVLGGVALTGLPAGAVTPGTNGTIMFVANEPCNPNVSFCEPGAMTRAIFEMKPDGTGVTTRPRPELLGRLAEPERQRQPDPLRATFGDPEIYKAQRSGNDFEGYVTDGCGMSWAPDNDRIALTSEAGLLRHARPAHPAVPGWRRRRLPPATSRSPPADLGAA